MVTLETSALCKSLPEAEKAELRSMATTKSYAAREEIFREGDPGDGVYVVLAGRVGISAQLDTGERRVFSEVGPGDFFGEMAVLDQQTRSASATAMEATQVSFIPRESIIGLLTRSTGLSMALLQEISQRMREFNRQYFREVLQAERMAVIGRFASAIVHDLKNPLTIISITAEAVCREAARPELGRDCERRIQRQIERITGMVNDILEFTRGAAEPVLLTLMDYGAFIQSVVDEIRPDIARKSVEIDMPAPPPAIKLRLHPRRLTRVFYNLILNAVDEMPGGGRVSITFRSGPGELETRVADTGKGIAPEIIDRLFEPFATHGKIKGTGLGLSICRRIVEEHGGRIEACNQEGGGAVLTLTLPVPPQTPENL